MLAIPTNLCIQATQGANCAAKRRSTCHMATSMRSERAAEVAVLGVASDTLGRTVPTSQS